MTETTFVIVIGIFFFGAIFDFYMETKQAIKNDVLSLSKMSAEQFFKYFLFQRSISTIIVTGLIWWLESKFLLSILICYIALGVSLLVILLLPPIKRKIQHKKAEKDKIKLMIETDKIKAIVKEVFKNMKD